MCQAFGLTTDGGFLRCVSEGTARPAGGSSSSLSVMLPVATRGLRRIGSLGHLCLSGTFSMTHWTLPRTSLPGAVLLRRRFWIRSWSLMTTGRSSSGSSMTVSRRRLPVGCGMMPRRRRFRRASPGAAAKVSGRRAFKRRSSSPTRTPQTWCSACGVRCATCPSVHRASFSGLVGTRMRPGFRNRLRHS